MIEDINLLNWKELDIPNSCVKLAPNSPLQIADLKYPSLEVAVLVFDAHVLEKSVGIAEKLNRGY